MQINRTELTALVERLARVAPTSRLDWSDAWSETDLQEFTAESLRCFDEAERFDPLS